MSNDQFLSLDVHSAKDVLSRLHEQVVAGQGRVELHSDGIEGVSVIISREELESLERALAILSDAEGVREMCRMLHRMAEAATVVHHATCNEPDASACSAS